LIPSQFINIRWDQTIAPNGAFRKLEERRKEILEQWVKTWYVPVTTNLVDGWHLLVVEGKSYWILLDEGLEKWHSLEDGRFYYSVL